MDLTSIKANAAQVFHALARARAEGIDMIPRSPGDKEYFAQDWFRDRLEEIGIPYAQQGRNSYPDFLVGSGDGLAGYEIKSLSFSSGRPARKDIDFNSTIPSGKKEGMHVFLVFFLYEGRREEPRSVHTIAVAHGDLINSDHQVADEHVNIKIKPFGSYADGFIRNRKMYVFPHPVSIEPTVLGEARLLVPSDWNVKATTVRKVGVVGRTKADEALNSYWINLYGRGEPKIVRDAYDDAGREISFDIFAPVFGVM